MAQQVICITQARMTSSRLPGKIMREVLGQPLLGFHLERLRSSGVLDKVVVATTSNTSDDIVVDYCDSIGVPVYRGDENDVLGRINGAIETLGPDAEIVARLTADCPLIDPRLVMQAIRMLGDGYDYVATDSTKLPHGFDAEATTRTALQTAHARSVDPFEREHVTPYIYRRKSDFRCGVVSVDRDYSSIRLCVDEEADFELVRRVLETLWPKNPAFTWRDCVDLVTENPSWQAINQLVQQRHPDALRERSGKNSE